MAHAMAPQAKLFLVVSKLQNTDPTWAAVQLARSWSLKTVVAWSA